MFSESNRIKILIYSLVSIGLLSFGSIRRLTDNFVDETTKTMVLSRTKIYFDNILQALDSSNSIFSSLITVLFWAAVGAILYVALWIIFSAIKDYLFEIKVSLFFVHPNSFKESQHWLAVISRGILKIATSIVLVVYSIVFIKALYPALLDQFTSGLLVRTFRSITVDTIGSIILMLTAIYIFSFLIRILFPRPAIIEAD